MLKTEAQEALRMSMASEQAARSRRLANSTLGYYNLQAGPTAWRFQSALGMEWNDNIALTGTDSLSDFIFRPELNAQMLWPLTDKNALNLRLGAGYSAYVQNPGYSRFYVRPGSEISFDVYTGDFTINFHDRFSILEDSYQDPTIFGNGDYSRLENAIGVAALWDMNKLQIRSGYDHVSYVSLHGTGNVPDGESEMFYGSGGYEVEGFGLAGLELGGGLVDYTRGGVDASQWNAGLFGESQLSDYIRLRGSAGYMVYSPAQPVLGGGGDFSGMYFQVTARHLLNEFVHYDLSAGRSVNFDFYGGSVASWFVRWSANWNLLRKFSLNTSVDYQRGEELQYAREQFDWIGGGFTLGRQLTRKLTATGGYRIYARNSSLPSRNYVVNTVSLQFNYAF